MSNLKQDYEAFVAKLFNRTGDLSKDFTHACLGIYTEIDELFASKEHLEALLEAGDLMFFQTALDLVVDEYVKEAFGDLPASDVLSLCKESKEATLGYARTQHHEDVLKVFGMNLLDTSKRWVGYGKAPTLRQVFDVLHQAHVMAPLAVAYSLVVDTTIEEVVRANMAKLLKRYPGGEFDAYRAVNRDTEAEREAAQQA